MASITSVISLFVLLLATYCYAVPVHFTTEKPMLGQHHTTDMFSEHTTFANMMSGKHTREERESESEEGTTERVIKRNEESNMEHNFEDFTSSPFDMTTEMHTMREMDDDKSEEHTAEHFTVKPMKHMFEDITLPSVELTTEMHKIRNMESEDVTFPTATFGAVSDETRSFEHDKDMKFTTERVPHHVGEFEHGLYTTEPLSHETREFEHSSFPTLESSTEFADRAIRGSPEWFEREVRAAPEWFEREARSYAEPEVESEEKKVLPIEHISLDKTKSFETESSVDSYGKTTGLLHEEIKPVVTEIKTIHPVEDSYTHVEKIVPGTFHETKLLHEDKEILGNDYETKVIHHDIVPMKKVLDNDYETKVIREVPHKDLLVKDYETVKPALEQGSNLLLFLVAAFSFCAFLIASITAAVSSFQKKRNLPES
ncbi:unnamed protein product [Adineta steineri]|uniref:Uncharacterized protein n=1 Tax=Adineta steineri TaxID=433720 RepID=A0A818H5H8_9BILA|nr:unnamed protein product [Adineta steineri]CAF3499575.1 unnamed protein product [Adineta steineri]